jgi:putative tryptophan/tyrosine transport system substrate-binding protein
MGAATASVASPWLAALVQGLRDLGWVDGNNIAIEVRWAEGRNERAAEIVAEFVRLKTDIIVTWATAPALAAKRATTTIPIVFALATDPVGSGLVDSLARPGGNITGLSALNIDLIGKRIELFREIIPHLRRLAIMANVGVLDTAAEMREVATTGRTLGLDIKTFEIRRADEIAPAFEALKENVDALFVVGDPLTFTNRAQIIALAQNAKLPTTYACPALVSDLCRVMRGPVGHRVKERREPSAGCRSVSGRPLQRSACRRRRCNSGRTGRRLGCIFCGLS